MVWPFDKERERKRFPEFNLTTFLIMVVIALVGLQVFQDFFGKAVGSSFRSGPLFILLGVGAVSLATIAVAAMLLKGMEISKQTLVALLVLAGLTILMMFFLPDLVPQVFQQSFHNLQSFVGVN